jgi:hypothetical protein
MNRQEHLSTARMMIDAHGLRAQALALQHMEEHRQQHDTAGVERWQDIHAAIAELRRSDAGASPHR